jgi:hypothetical protein
MSSFPIKQGDTAPSLRAILSNTEGPINLTGTTVKFAMKAAPTRANANPPEILVVAVVEEPQSGLVRYDWSGTDTALAGPYVAEFIVTSSAGKVERYPSSGFISVTILPNI